MLVSSASVALSAPLIGSPTKSPSKPLILSGLQRYEADRQGVYQMTTAISDDRPYGVGLDARGNLYSFNNGTNTITIYAPGSASGATPQATIAGPDTGLSGFAPFAVDQKGNLFTVAPSTVAAAPGLTLVTYAAGSSGDASPSSTSYVSSSILNDSAGIAVDAKDNLYVTNTYGPTANQVTPGSVVIFAARSGPIPRGTISGAATGLITPGPIAIDSAGKIYVANVGQLAKNAGLGPDVSSIVVFRAGSSGNVKPIATISGAATGLGQYVTGLALDGAGNLYVSSIVIVPGSKSKGTSTTYQYQYQIQVFAAGSNGNVAPIATIAGDATGLFTSTGPNAIAVSAAGEIFVANAGANSITVYAPGSTGNVPPIVTISRGPSGAMDDPEGVAFDTSGNIYALQQVAGDTSDSIAVWAPGSTDSPPLRTIAIARTLNEKPLGFAVDAADNIYVGRPPAPQSAGGSVDEYAAGSSGSAQPVRTITGPDTGIGQPTALALDRAGNLYVASWIDGGGVSVFAPAADGDATPIQLIGGAATAINTPESIAVDSKDAIYVGNGAAGNATPQVTIYSPGSTDDAAPQSVLPARFGSNSGLAVDTAGNVYVASSSGIDIFPPGAGANSKPQTTILYLRSGPFFALFPAAQP